MKFVQMPVIPIPPDLVEAERWSHTRLRRRMLDGEWKQDLEDRIQAQLGTTRREAWGAVDMSANVFRVVCQALSALYDRAPRVVHMDDASDFLGHVERWRSQGSGHQCDGFRVGSSGAEST